jgi:hypothetical protein
VANIQKWLKPLMPVNGGHRAVANWIQQE